MKLFGLIAAVIAFILCAWAFQQHATEIIAWINGLGWLAPVLFVLTYCFATIMFLPTMVLTLAGGAIFGPVVGTTLNLIGATSGAAVSFLITRHLLYDWCSQRRGARLNKLIAGVEQKGWLFVAILRLFPIIPFNLINYGLGITNIKFRLYVIITFIFLIPGEIIYTYCGYAGMGAMTQPEHIYRDGLILLAAIAILIFIIKLLNKKNIDE